MSVNTIGWRFPLNHDGEDDHLSQPGIEDFRNTPIISLAREICQNSLDAKDPTSFSPVEVDFNLITLPKDSFPGHGSYVTRLEACASYQPDSPKTQVFFKKAIEVANGDQIPFLLISDYQTTGCKGVSGKNTDWYKLTKAVGSSDKSDGLGSFGIGKFAPYANSDLRTVFYSTRNIDNEIAFQGVSRLISHEWEGDVTRGTGYFGLTEKNEPLTEPIAIPEVFSRKKVGTTIAIAGFQATPDWEFKIIEAVLESFFYAILSEKLVVRAGEHVVTHANLGMWVSSLETGLGKGYVRNGSSNVPYYYKAIISSDAEEFKDENFRGKGKISLRLLTGRDFPKRVAIVRGSGMKIFDKAQFQTAMKFAGVFNAEGDEVNRYLKSMEPQQHDKLVPGRADNPKEAEIFLKALYRWINDRIREVAERQFTSEADIEGVSKFLPDDSEDVVKAEEPDDVEEPIKAADSIPLTFRTTKTLPKRVDSPAFETLPDEVDLPSDFPEFDDEKPNPPNPNPPKPNDSVPGGLQPGMGGAVNPGEGPKTATKGSQVALRKARSFGTDRENRSLVVTFVPEQDGIGSLALTARGETIQAEVPVLRARLLPSGMDVPVTADGRVGPLPIKKDQDHKIEVTLVKPSRFAMEVVLYAD